MNIDLDQVKAILKPNSRSSAQELQDLRKQVAEIYALVADSMRLLNDIDSVLRTREKSGG